MTFFLQRPAGNSEDDYISEDAAHRGLGADQADDLQCPRELLTTVKCCRVLSLSSAEANSAPQPLTPPHMSLPSPVQEDQDMCVTFGYDLKSKGFYASIKENNWTVRMLSAQAAALLRNTTTAASRREV